jgi:hypothetical protein
MKRLSSGSFRRHSLFMLILVDKILTQIAMPLGLGLLVLAFAVLAMFLGRRRQALARWRSQVC